MISVSDLKDKIASVYRWGADRGEEKKLERLRLLEQQYPDDKLAEIIENTRLFLIDAINSPTFNHGYVSIPLDEDTTEYIGLNLMGGWFSEKLFTDDKGRLISQTVVESVLGDCECDIRYNPYTYESPDDPDVMSEGCDIELYLGHYKDYIQSAKEELIGKPITIKRDKRE